MTDDTSHRSPDSRRMSFDEMTARAQYEWDRAEKAEAEARAMAERAETAEARLSTIEAETIERCAQAVHGAVQMIPMGQVDASEFLDVIEDAIAAAIRKLAQEVKHEAE